MILCCVLFLFGLGVQFYVTLFVLVYLLIGVDYKRYLDYDVILLGCFLLSYTLLDTDSLIGGGLMGKLRLLLLSVGGYYIGQDLYMGRQETQLTGVIALVFFVLGVGVKGILAFLYTIYNYPEAVLARQYYDFFEKSQGPFHALGLSSYLLVAMALMPVLLYGLFRLRGQFALLEKGLMVLVIVVGAYGFYVSNLFQNRTPFAVFAAAAFAPLVIPDKTEKKRYGWSLVLMIIMAAFLYISYADSLRLLEVGVLSRPSEEVSTLTGRTSHWAHGLESIMQYPFGGQVYYVEGRPYWYHNYWLDILRVSGIIPLIGIIWFHVRHFFMLNHDLIRGGWFDGSILVVCLLALFLLFMTGPILDGQLQPHYYSLVVFGYIKGMYLCDEETSGVGRGL